MCTLSLSMLMFILVVVSMSSCCSNVNSSKIIRLSHIFHRILLQIIVPVDYNPLLLQGCRLNLPMKLFNMFATSVPFDIILFSSWRQIFCKILVLLDKNGLIVCKNCLLSVTFHGLRFS